MNIQTGNPLNTKKIILYFALITLLLINWACIFPATWTNPGYEVSVSVKKMESSELPVLENSIKTENYTFQWKNQIPGRLCMGYSKDISTIEQLKQKNVKVIVCFDDNNKSHLLTNFEILIINEWDGQKPEIKKEIDRMGDKLSDEISKLVKMEKILIERKPTGPHL